MAQHDYVIDNSTGANVRADINNALLAISSNNSGSSAPSTTYALQTFANTTDTMLQLRNAANNAFVNLRKFDGSLPLPDGSNSAPSLFFDDDTNTGIYSSAADAFNIATAGVNRLEIGTELVINETGVDFDFRIESDTNTNCFRLDAGNSGIGINQAPTTGYALDILGNSGYDDVFRITGVGTNIGPRINLTPTGTGTSRINATSGFLGFQVGGVTQMSIGNTGTKPVLIGSTVITSEKLTVLDAGNAFMSIRSDGEADDQVQVLDFVTGTAERTSDNMTASIGATIHSQSGGTLKADLSFSTNGGDSQTQKMIIKHDGKVGIGTSIPQLCKLHIGPDEFGLNLQNNSSNISKILFSKNSQGNDARTSIHGNGELSGHLLLFVGDNSRLKIFGDGDAFLGGAAGADVTGNSNSKGFVYDNDTTSAGNAGGNHPFVTVQHGTKTTGAASYINFQSQTAIRGSVVESNSGNNVTYNTSSDYRLKQDEVLISDGITRLKQLKPYQFKWKENPEYGYVDGFFAHEVGEVVKGAATGTKDEVVTQSGIDDGTYKGGVKLGDVVPQGLDYGRITPLLTAALKEAVAKIEVLETKVAALEAA